MTFSSAILSIFYKVWEEWNHFGLLQRQTEHQGTNIKHLCINCYKKDSRCLSIMAFWQQRLSITALHLQPIIHVEEVLSSSFTVKSGRKVWFSLFCQRNRGHFTTNLSFRHEFHQRNCILPLEWTSLGSLCCQYILTILISLSK